MKKLTLAIALFAFVGSASVNASVKSEGEKIEKTEKKVKNSLPRIKALKNSRWLINIAGGAKGPYSTMPTCGE